MGYLPARMGFKPRAVGVLDAKRQRSSVVEIGDTIEMEGAGVEDDAARSSKPTGTRRKNGRNGGRARNGKPSGQGNGASGQDVEHEVALLAPGGKIRGIDLRRVLGAIRDLRDGDFDARLPLSEDPLLAEISDAFNSVAKLNERLCDEMTRVAKTIGREGQMNDRASIGPAIGGWRSTVESVNTLITDLASPTTEVARVLSAVAEGDLSQKMVLEIDGKPVQGEFLRIGTTVNIMVDQLGSFANEVTRVAREVGTEGKLGGQAEVPGVGGTWKDLTDNVNTLAGNLTSQVRNIAAVTTAVAKGNLSQKITVEARGETLELKNTINTMVDQLSAFASEVTRVAREVGTEGKLGGQAQVPGVAGTWKDLTDNVNSMATNLTSQVRAIAEVATAVTKGDLTRSIQVDALGELSELKDKLNTMIDNLRLTTERNTEQDWLKTNLAKFTNMLQGQRDLGTVGRLLLRELTPLVGAHQAVIYQTQSEGSEDTNLRLLSVYADSGGAG